MRHLYSTAVAIMSNNYQHVIPAAHESIKHIPPSDWGKYIHLTFGHEAASMDVDNCTSLALNIGQWPVSYSAGARPWTIQRYRSTVERMIDTVLLRARHLNGSMSWVSTQVHGLVRGLHGSESSPPTDGRPDPYILHENALMQGMSATWGLPYIDTVSVINPLTDRSYDSGHYVGTPGMWATAFAMHHLCAP
jgi:hypothetical protein